MKRRRRRRRRRAAPALNAFVTTASAAKATSSMLALGLQIFGAGACVANELSVWAAESELSALACAPAGISAGTEYVLSTGTNATADIG